MDGRCSKTCRKKPPADRITTKGQGIKGLGGQAECTSSLVGVSLLCAASASPHPGREIDYLHSTKRKISFEEVQYVVIAESDQDGVMSPLP